jgi:hypothetical protein
MITYPKIETLYDRDLNTFKVMTDHVRCPEFDNVKHWHVSEKIDGTNLRIQWTEETEEISFGGRTDNAQLPMSIVEHLRKTFTPSSFDNFTSDVILFGEGYGEKIQKGGGNYCKGVSFRLFDVLVGNKWWLEPYDVAAVAASMGINIAPHLGVICTLPRSLDDLLAILDDSIVAHTENHTKYQAEGIVARSYPLLLNRAGNRVMWKLKVKDF